MLKKNEPRIIPDLEAFALEKPASHSLHLVIKEGYKSSLTYPLITLGQKRVGFLFFNSVQKDCYQPHHLDTFRHISVMVSTTIEKSRLYEKILTEEERSANLLHQMVPPPIAARLRSNEHPIADKHEVVGVLFADIVGFTTWSSALEASTVVSVLEEIFRQVDELAGVWGIEKIKTIGDCWMGAVGVTGQSTMDLAKLVHFAHAMGSVPARHQLSFRVGIHMGPCVAGVIGRNKMAYDIWGDTVNVASRMESTGEANRVHISRDVMQLLLHQDDDDDDDDDRAGNDFRFIPRGSTAIKGKGQMETFFVEPAVGQRE